MEIILSLIALFISVLFYLSVTQTLKDKKKEFKRISGMDYDEYIKKERLNKK
jgi:hypothetical protein